MSDSDSDADSDACRPTRRRNAVGTKKRELRDSSSHSSDSSDGSGSDSQSDSNTTASDTANSDDEDIDSSEASVSDEPEDASPVQKPLAKRARRLPASSSSDEAPKQQRAASSSGSDVAAKRRPTARPYIYDDDSESSDSSWNPNADVSSHSSGARRGAGAGSGSSDPQPSTSAAARRNDALAAAAAAAATTATTSGATAAASSSDDDANGDDKCPICLHSFRDQPLGVPDACEHSYCLSCIEEWANNVQTCPIDRLPFTSIARYEGGRLVGRIPVEARTTELQLADDADLTHCEVCAATDREESMLLCDGCNRGYHMDCLQPALTEIPASAWYCDYCFDSDASADDDEDIGQLLSEMQQIGVPPTRLRVRPVSESTAAPRITRTRQSERIRATILSRIAPSRRHAPVGSRESALGMPLPEPSARRTSRTTRTRTTRRVTTTTTTTTNRATRPATTRRKRRTVKRKVKRRTTRVVEYENGEDGQKFPVKTAKKPAASKRKRKTSKRKSTKKKATKSSRRGCSTRTGNRTLNTSSEHDAAAATAATGSSGRMHLAIPRLHLFGDPNALDYFSDEHDDGNASDENVGRGLGGTGDGGQLFAATFARSRIGNAASVLRRQKRVLSALHTGAASASVGADSLDVLSNIMDTMDRWHDMTKPASMDKIRIDADGKLSVAPTGSKVVKKAKATEAANVAGGPEVMAAPRYPSGGGGGGGGGGYNNRNQGGGFRGNDSSGSTGMNGTASVNSSSLNSSSSSGGSGMSFSIFGPRNLSAPIGGVGGGGGAGGHNGSDGPNMYNDFQPRSNRDRQQPPPFRQNNNTNSNFNSNSANDNAQRFQSNRNFCDNPSQPFQHQQHNALSDNQQPFQHQPHNTAGGMYDDPNMPAAMHAMHPITSLPAHMMNQPMQHQLPPQQFVSTAMMQPSLMAPAHFMPTPFLAPPPAMMPMATLFSVEENNTPYVPPREPTPPPVAANASASEPYDPTVADSESESDDDTDTLDIPLPVSDAPATAAAAVTGGTIAGIASYGAGSSDDDAGSSDDCPNLAVYSAESMDVARNLKSGSPGSGTNAGGSAAGASVDADVEELERDEDLVQLDDDDEDDAAAEPDNTNADAEHDKSTAKKNILDLHDDSDWEELNNDRSGEGSDIAEKGGNADASASADMPKANQTEQDDDGKRRSRSFTPCLDEQVPVTSEAGDSVDAIHISAANSNRAGSSDEDDDAGSGIAGMQTELISDDDAEDILNGKSPRSRQQRSQRRRRSDAGRDDKRSLDKRKGDGDDGGAAVPRKRGAVESSDRDKKTSSSKASKPQPTEREQSFKKLSGSNKDRNYRDKKEEPASSSRRRRSRSRSHNNKENRSRGRGGSAHRRESSDVRRRGGGGGGGGSGDSKRKDMERYDVRNVIADRQPRPNKDQYGRDTSRPRSRSASRRGAARGGARGAHSRTRSRSPGPSRPRRSHSRGPAASTSGVRRSSVSPRSRRRHSGHRRAPSVSPPAAAAASSAHRRRVSRSPLVAVRRDRSPSAARSRSHHRHQHQHHTVNGKSSSAAVVHRSQPHAPKKPRSPEPLPVPPAPKPQQSQRHRSRRSPSVARSVSSPPSVSKSRKKSSKRSKAKKRKLSAVDAHQFDQPQPQPLAHRMDFSALPGGKRPTYSQARTRSPSWEPAHAQHPHTGTAPHVDTWQEHTERLSPWSRSPTPDSTTRDSDVGPGAGALAWTTSADNADVHIAVKPNVGENLTVILKNKDSGGSAKRASKKLKKRSKDKRTKDSAGDKRERRSKRDKGSTHTAGGSALLATGSGKSAPSKEVFASGDNILVSVSFNKDSAGKSGNSSGSKHHQQTTIVTLPASKDLISGKKGNNCPLSITASASSGSAAVSARRARLLESSASTSGVQRHRKISQKPVAIIDLDRSPFQEITTSPRAVIVLDSDSDTYADDDVEEIRSLGRQTPPVNSATVAAAAGASKSTQPAASVGSRMSSIGQLTDEQHNVEQVSQPQSPNADSDFDVSAGGPKTPPEPSASKTAAASVASPSQQTQAKVNAIFALASLVKFSLPLKNKLRATNPLHEAIEEDPTPSQMQQQQPTASMLGNSANADTASVMDTSISSQPSPASQNATATTIALRSPHGSSTTQPQQSPLSTTTADSNTANATTTTTVTTASISPIATQQSVVHNKIGPNTPPESGPCSPDVYDPFEPTESATTSPQHGQPDDSPTDGHRSTVAPNDADADRFESHTPPPPVAPSISQPPDKSLNSNLSGSSSSAVPQSVAGKSVKPVDLAMALINSKASLDAANTFLSSSLDGGKNATAAATAYDIPGGGGGGGSSSHHQTTHELSDDADDVQIVHPNSGSSSSSRPPTIAMRRTTQDVRGLSGASMRQSPMKSHGGSSSVNAKLSMPSKPSGGKSASATARPLNGSSGGGSIGDDPMDGMLASASSAAVAHVSPYSPDSSDFDDLFEPPPISPGQLSDSQQQQQQQQQLPFGKKPSHSQRHKQVDVLDDLFGGSSPPQQQLHKLGGRPAASGNGKRSSAAGASTSQRLRAKHSATAGRGSTAKQPVPSTGRLNDEQQRLFDEIPGSAVEMQAQEQYLTKLNRLDRVVEEVRLVLKPHFSKKYITKEDYKEILRRAVPKINHNRTGEINPKKIKTLIEAYVRKFRHRRKPHQHGSSGGQANMSAD